MNEHENASACPWTDADMIACWLPLPLLCRYERLQLLEKEAKLTVFPFIDVESKMENKVRAWVTSKKQCGSVRWTVADGLTASPHLFLCWLPQDSYLTAIMRSPRPYVLLETKVKSSGMAGSSAALTMTHSDYGVDWTHRPHNGRTAPTAIIPSVSQLFEQPEVKQLNFMQHITCLLRAEVEKAGWQVHEPELWVIKVRRTCAQ